MHLRASLNSFLAVTGFRLIAQENYEALSVDPRYRAGKLWKNSLAPKELKYFVFQNLRYSNSQIQQDLFCSWTIETAYKIGLLTGTADRFFVEFGATNGFQLSNSFFLEIYRKWRGILCEPAKIWHQDLMNLRKCAVDFRCVFKKSGDFLLFTQADNPELGTLAQFKDVDGHAISRTSGEDYLVETVSLNHLLDHHQAPRFIDYLSIDTEGSEFEILQSFDFGSYSFGVITVEHNFTENRNLLYKLLTSQGYVRVLTEVSGQDDWYVNGLIKSIFTRSVNEK